MVWLKVIEWARTRVPSQGYPNSLDGITRRYNKMSHDTGPSQRYPNSWDGMTGSSRMSQDKSAVTRLSQQRASVVAVPRPLCGSATRLTLQDTGITRTLTTSPWLYIIDRPVHIVSQLRDSSVRRVFVLDIILSSSLLSSPRRLDLFSSSAKPQPAFISL